MKTDKGKIRRQIFFPLGVALLILAVGAVAGFYNHMLYFNEKQVQARLEGIQHMFQDELNREAQLMNGLIDFIKKDQRLQKLWLAKDRESLLRYATPIFKDILSEYRVTHFYFHDRDRVNFLRVHRPTSLGGYIGRFTMDKATKTGKAAHGIELGQTGTFTLRVVHPWRIDGELVGYIELGEEIAHITPRLSKILGTELILVLDKRYLDRAMWEKGLKIIGRTGDWDRFPGSVIIDRTIDVESLRLQELIDRSYREQTDLKFDIVSEGRRYLGGFVSLVDAGGNDVGDIVVMNDITEEQAELGIFITYLTGGVILIGAFLFLFFWYFLGTIESKLVMYQNDLKSEIEVHRQAEEALRLAMEKAEGANVSKSAFLANINHEIRTPLNGVLGMIDLTLDTDLDPEQRENLQIANSSADSLLRLIDDILDFSKIEAGKPDFEVCSLDLVQVIQSTVDPLSFEAKEKGIELDYHIASGVPGRLVGDPGRLRQVIQNLIANAIKFTKSGGVKIRVEVSESTQESVLLHFLVEDSGIGIPEKELDEIFKAFTQVDASSTRRYGGAGLGLSICRNLVQMMGGQIWVESRPGTGSIFHFTARLGTNVELPKNEALAEQSMVRYPDPAGNEKVGLNILIVDDDVVSRQVAAGLLKRGSHRVTVVTDGQEAVESFERENFDLIFMDLGMPGMNGLEATRCIRQKEKETGSHIPIIAMTAYTFEEDRGRCLEAGMDGHVSKPVRRIDLFDAIGRTVPRVHGATALSGSIPASKEPTVVSEAFKISNVSEELEGNGKLPEGKDDHLLDGALDLVVKTKKALSDEDEKSMNNLGRELKQLATKLRVTHLADVVFRMQLAIRKSDMVRTASLLGEVKRELKSLKVTDSKQDNYG